MKIEILNDGCIAIERSGTMKRQMCFVSKEWCGDWCPQFGEPEPSAKEGYVTVILLCQGSRWHCKDFTDLRTRGDIGN